MRWVKGHVTPQSFARYRPAPSDITGNTIADYGAGQAQKLRDEENQTVISMFVGRQEKYAEIVQTLQLMQVRVAEAMLVRHRTLAIVSSPSLAIHAKGVRVRNIRPGNGRVLQARSVAALKLHSPDPPRRLDLVLLLRVQRMPAPL